jgi:hypothetical protein
MTNLNLDRLVRSAINGSAGEPYCSFIIEATGRHDGTRAFPTVESIDKFWQGALDSGYTVEEFIEKHQWGYEA